MIYLAGAYSHNPALAAKLHLCLAQQFVRAGLMVYSPITYGHAVAPHAPYHYWITHGMMMLPKCERIHVVDSPDLPAHASRGVTLEIEQAILHSLVRTQQYIVNVERFLRTAANDSTMPA